MKRKLYLSIILSLYTLFIGCFGYISERGVIEKVVSFFAADAQAKNLIDSPRFDGQTEVGYVQSLRGSSNGQNNGDPTPNPPVPPPPPPKPEDSNRPE